MGAVELASLPLAERSVVSACHVLVGRVDDSLHAMRFSEAARLLSDFVWNDWADWYLEASKTRFKAGGASIAAGAGNASIAKIDDQARRVLVYVWDTCLRLLHPLLPFATEALWQLIPHRGDSLMVAAWPAAASSSSPSFEPLPVDQNALAAFASLQALVRALRNARAEHRVEPGRKIAALIVLSTAKDAGAAMGLCRLLEGDR